MRHGVCRELDAMREILRLTPFRMNIVGAVACFNMVAFFLCFVAIHLVPRPGDTPSTAHAILLQSLNVITSPLCYVLLPQAWSLCASAAEVFMKTAVCVVGNAYLWGATAWCVARLVPNTGIRKGSI